MSGRDIRPVSVPQFKVPKVNFGAAGGAVLLLIVLILLWTTVFTVDPEEVGVVLTFGKYTREASPGMNFKLPTPIQTVTKVAVQRQLKEEFGFRTATVGVRSTYSNRSFEDESLMLTGDLNVAVVDWTTQYRVNNPFNYLFRVRNVEETFRDMNEAVMRAVVGDRSVTEVLTIGREEIALEVETRLQDLCNQYETGIKVEQVVLQDVNPPDEVKDSFNEVNQAQQERERMINEALTEKNRIIPRARGEALQAIQEAEGYATDRVNRAQGDVARFEALLAAYKRSPDVTRQRIYLETMEKILPAVERKIIIDDDLKGVLPLLSLGEKGGTP